MTISRATIKKMMGKPMPNMLRDTDRDKVIDILDCEPRNPKKQGLRHDLAKAVAKRSPFKRKEAVAFVERREREFDEERVLRRTTRRKERLKTVQFEEERGQSRRAFAKRGGIRGSLGAGFRDLALGIRAGPLGTELRGPIKRKAKKSKRRKKK
ncbi:hypothetical protein LCGC14_1219060 [marine sediment metagenome]|uniref:Uncharacterized protein n=1 Tax=marine sediment metagenome TaxID=412755 RepID=A0A0F9LZ66_9ZZZZ